MACIDKFTESFVRSLFKKKAYYADILSKFAIAKQQGEKQCNSMIKVSILLKFHMEKIEIISI